MKMLRHMFLYFKSKNDDLRNLTFYTLKEKLYKDTFSNM